MAAVEYLVKFRDLATRDEQSITDSLWDSLISSPNIACKVTNKEFYANIPTGEIRQLGPVRIELWLLKTVERLEGLCRYQSVGTPGGLGPQLSSCCRIISRLCPVLYESPKCHSILWKPRVKDDKPEVLGEKIIHCLSQLMHFRGFTVPVEVIGTDHRIIWAPGVGCPLGPTDALHPSVMEARREILCSMLAVLSEPLHLKCSCALDYWTSVTKEPFIFCSLLNFGLNTSSGANWILNSIKSQFNSSTLETQSLALNLLLIAVTHLPPAPRKNQFRRLLSKINKDEDLDSLVDKICTSFSSHVYGGAGGSWNPGSASIIATANLSVCLAWELIQANSHFARNPSCARLAQSVVTGLLVGDQSDPANTKLYDNLKRLSAYTLLSLTAVNPHAAEAVGYDIWHAVVAHRSELNQPGIHLASVIDILYNCSPFTRLSDFAANDFKDTIAKLSNPAVAAMFSRIEQNLSQINPQLQGKDDNQTAEHNEYSPIFFQWDDTRLDWYKKNLWGITLQYEPDILDASAVKFFKLEPQNIPTSSELASSLVHKVGNVFSKRT